MPDVIDQLRRYGDAIEAHLSETPVELEQVSLATDTQRHRSRGCAFMRAAAGLIVVAALLGMIVAARHDEPKVAKASAPTMLFGSPTGIVLLFSDGIDGATALDPDRLLVGRRIIEGERAGDAEFHLTLVGDRFVVGWGEIYAAPVDGGPSTKIDDATIYIPAAEPNEVWTLTWPSGHIDGGPAVLRRVDTRGNVRFQTTEFNPSEYQALLGVPGGLAVQTNRGVAVWDAATQAIGPILGPGPASSTTSDGQHLAWCENSCATTHVVDLAHTGDATPQFAGLREAALAPDGRSLAILRHVSDVGTELIIRDLATDRERVVGRGLGLGTILWAPDGRQVFVVSDSVGQATTTIGRYDLRTRRWEPRQLELDKQFAGIAITPLQAHSFFSATITSAHDCPPVARSYPSNRTGTCTFSIRDKIR